jgi:hypothetical protein
MLETLCIQAVTSEPALADAWACVDQFFSCLHARNVPVPADASLAKRQAQTYLATQPELKAFPGLAAYKEYWPWNNAVFEPIKQFLRDL